jgi:hypothetical protein
MRSQQNSPARPSLIIACLAGRFAIRQCAKFMSLSGCGLREAGDPTIFAGLDQNGCRADALWLKRLQGQGNELPPATP